MTARLLDRTSYVIESTATGRDWFVVAGPFAGWVEACTAFTNLERARTGRPHRIVRERLVREVPVQPITAEVTLPRTAYGTPGGTTYAPPGDDHTIWDASCARCVAAVEEVADRLVADMVAEGQS